MTKEEVEKWLDDSVSDIFMDFMYYHRKSDEDMSIETLNTLMCNGVISEEMMIKSFTKYIKHQYN